MQTPENFFFALVALALTTVTLWPQLRAVLLFGDRWAPILPPPVQIGDDYHYFVLMKKFDLKILDFFNGEPKNREVPGTLTTQFLGYLLIWPSYRIGTLLGDRRLGVIGVLATSRFSLTLLGQVLISKILANGDGVMEAMVSSLIFLAAFLLAKGPGGGILQNLFNRRHIYDGSYSNEMTRGYVAETTTPILLFGILLTLESVENPDQFLWALAALIWLAITSFVYPPTFIALGIFQITFFTLNGMWLESILSFAFLLTLGIVTVFLLRRDKMSAGLIFKPTLRSLSPVKALVPALLDNIFEIGLLAVTSYVFLLSEWGNWQESEYAALFLAASVPIAFAFLGTGHISRVWVRAWAQAFTIIFLALLTDMFLNLADVRELGIIGLLLLTGVGYLIFFYYNRQQEFLVGVSYMSVSTEEKILISRLSQEPNLVSVTDSITAALWIDLYTDKSSLLSNYSTQSKDYRGHVRAVVECLKTCGWSEQRIFEALTLNVNYADWIGLRPIPANHPLQQTAFFHTLQYYATNREYNVDLIDDGMFIPSSGWSKKYESLIREFCR